MAFSTNNLILPTLNNVEPKELIKVAQTIKSRGNNIQKKSRTLEEIIKDIEKNHPENINSIEWIYLLFNLTKWEKNNQKKSTLIAQKIWKLAQRDNFLKLKLFWRLILNHFEPNQKYFASSLVNSFITFTPESDRDKNTFKIVKLLLSYSYEELGLLCCQLLKQPEEIFQKYNLPYKFNLENNLTLVETIKVKIPLTISKLNIDKKYINYLLCTTSNLSGKSQLIAVENLLLNIPPMVGGSYPKLVTWLKTHYSLTGTHSQWHQLSVRAKNALKQWIGALNYKDFEKLINVMTDKLSLPDWETKQLISRKVFWSNYSDRFDRIRILLPISTLDIVGNVENIEEMITLKDDGSEATEVCIFDFNEWLIVEFFRGKGSETRIFAKTSELEDLLFNSNDISLKKLRSLSISKDNVHDHVFCWQNDCERLLRSKLIYPNANTIFFKVVEDKKGFPYSFETGMPPLNGKKITERKRKLSRWKQDIQDLEE
ncbi:EH signature domain-containing protein [Cyanobacterium aponinum AL20118]|uniref:EH signature domain-containing protein n=1 Tax=Cyanobacterium aponinum AL20115 TaxID=3090662 RepID=A0AAF0ZG35_9CHRO|nr:EH signature domain-containing protein [Cyanobacterium aponinum]WPF89502.1 EH signature domain-containing protein [Cyanobacterium aponinum AL20115]